MVFAVLIEGYAKSGKVKMTQVGGLLADWIERKKRRTQGAKCL